MEALILSVLLVLFAVPASAQSIVTPQGVDMGAARANFVLRNPYYDGSQSVTVASGTFVNNTQGQASFRGYGPNGIDTNGGMIYIGNSANAGSRYSYTAAGSGTTYIDNIQAGTTGDGLIFRTNAANTTVMSITNAGAVTIPGSSFSVGTSTFVVKTGQVGIGTDAPDFNLAVRGTDPSFTLGANNANKLYMNFANGGGTGSIYTLTGGGYGGALNLQQNGGSFSVGTSTLTTKVGRVGIGVVSPDSALEVQARSSAADGTGSNYVKFKAATESRFDFDTGGTGSGARIIMYNDAEASKVLISASDGVASYINNGGNVGINNTTPNDKLDISSGTIRMAGTNAPAAGYALCLMTTTKQLGHCTNTPAADGTCTCSYP